MEIARIIDIRTVKINTGKLIGPRRFENVFRRANAMIIGYLKVVLDKHRLNFLIVLRIDQNIHVVIALNARIPSHNAEKCAVSNEPPTCCAQ